MIFQHDESIDDSLLDNYIDVRVGNERSLMHSWPNTTNCWQTHFHLQKRQSSKALDVLHDLFMCSDQYDLLIVNVWGKLVHCIHRKVSEIFI